MILFPAIDLKDGQCVRLKHGEMGSATIFNDDPGAQAAKFEAQGFGWLHIVDLDGAFAGRPVNGQAVDAILSAVKIPVQLGGGIRDLATIEMWLAKGVRRVILGTAAVRKPELVREACIKFPGRIAVGIDARDGRVAVAGWAEESNVMVAELARRFEDAGVAAIIFTDIGRDGALGGLNLEGTVALADLPPEAQHTLLLIRRGGPFPFARDGVAFGNHERLLPRRARGYYTEYTVPTPGRRDRGARRIIAGRGPRRDPATSGEYWYTGDHYRSFVRIEE